MLKGKVKDITFKGTVDVLKSCVLENGKVPMVSLQYVFSNIANISDWMQAFEA